MSEIKQNWQIIKDFNLFIKQFYLIVLSVKKYRIKKPRVAKTNKEKLMFLSKGAVCESNNSTFIIEQEVEGLLSMIGKILLIDLLLI